MGTYVWYYDTAQVTGEVSMAKRAIDAGLPLEFAHVVVDGSAGKIGNAP
jgi:hypothetical protein